MAIINHIGLGKPCARPLYSICSVNMHIYTPTFISVDGVYPQNWSAIKTFSVSTLEDVFVQEHGATESAFLDASKDKSCLCHRSFSKELLEKATNHMADKRKSFCIVCRFIRLWRGRTAGQEKKKKKEKALELASSCQCLLWMNDFDFCLHAWKCNHR